MLSFRVHYLIGGSLRTIRWKVWKGDLLINPTDISRALNCENQEETKIQKTAKIYLNRFGQTKYRWISIIDVVILLGHRNRYIRRMGLNTQFRVETITLRPCLNYLGTTASMHNLSLEMTSNRINHTFLCSPFEQAHQRQSFVAWTYIDRYSAWWFGQDLFLGLDALIHPPLSVEQVEVYFGLLNGHFVIETGKSLDKQRLTGEAQLYDLHHHKRRKPKLCE